MGSSDQTHPPDTASLTMRYAFPGEYSTAKQAGRTAPPGTIFFGQNTPSNMKIYDAFSIDSGPPFKDNNGESFENDERYLTSTFSLIIWRDILT